MPPFPPIFSFTHIINGFLRPHRLDECNHLFLTGENYTTPHLSTITPMVPSPWRSACIFLILLALSLGFTIGETYARLIFDNSVLFQGSVAVGNIVVPLSLVILLSEFNLWRNIPVLRTICLIAGGGLISVVFTSVLLHFQSDETEHLFAFATGVTEETAKILACIALAGSQFRNGRILNGILIGAAVGAGFSFFESMGHTFDAMHPRQAIQIEEGQVSINTNMKDVKTAPAATSKHTHTPRESTATQQAEPAANQLQPEADASDNNQKEFGNTPPPRKQDATLEKTAAPEGNRDNVNKIDEEEPPPTAYNVPLGVAFEKAYETMGKRALVAMASGHVLWTAIACGALWGLCGRRKIFFAVLHPVFLLVLAYCSLLHAGWNICCQRHWELQALPAQFVFTWGALCFVIFLGIRQIRNKQRAWYKHASEDERIFSLQMEDGDWDKPITAAELEGKLDEGQITRGTLCRVGECAIPVPAWHLCFIPKRQEQICSWWRVPSCTLYFICVWMGGIQLLAIAVTFLIQGRMVMLPTYLFALFCGLFTSFHWLTRLWMWSQRRFQMTEEETKASVFSPRSPLSMWLGLLIPVYNLVWSYRLYVKSVIRFNTTQPKGKQIPLWIPRLYWGNIVAITALAISMFSFFHQVQAYTVYFVILLVLFPVLSFFMARAMNCVNYELRSMAPEERSE